MQRGQMVLLTLAPDAFAARVIAARLGAEGIITELRGADGPYPIGEVPIFVEVARADVAREILALTEPDDDDGSSAPGRAPAAMWLLLASAVLSAIVAVARMFG